MSAPAAIANAVADALDRDDVELPLTAPRVWELLQGPGVKPAPFDYVRADSLEEALAALAEGGEDAKPIAGGQSLVPALAMRLVRPSLLVDLNRAGLDGVDANGALRLGATVRQAALAGDERVHPLVRAALPYVGHFVTRNRGTVGGSIAHADGAAELPLCLVALDGTVVVDGPDGRREIPADDFFVTHFLTTLAPGELVVETVWPLAGGETSAFEEFALRHGRLRAVDGVLRANPRRRRRGRGARVASAPSPTVRPGSPRSRRSSSGRAASRRRPRPARSPRGSSTRRGRSTRATRTSAR